MLNVAKGNHAITKPDTMARVNCKDNNESLPTELSNIFDQKIVTKHSINLFTLVSFMSISFRVSCRLCFPLDHFALIPLVLLFIL